MTFVISSLIFVFSRCAHTKSTARMINPSMMNGNPGPSTPGMVRIKPTSNTTNPTVMCATSFP